MNDDLAPTPQQLVQAISKNMPSTLPEWFGSYTDWTDRLNSALCELFHRDGPNGTDVMCSQKKHDNHEFLLDVLVWDRSSGDGVVLAVESEWTQAVADIVQDFRKLLVVKSPVKLMVFALNPKAWKHTQQEVWTNLGAHLLRYRDHRKGERYIFIDYAPGPARSAWWIEIPNDGRLTLVPERHPIEFGCG